MVLFPNKTTTMKQNIVVKVNMNDLKSRSKALKIASGLLGVESVSLKGYDKTKLEIIGDGMIDVAQLTSMLRESLGYAEPVSVNSAGDGGEKKEAETKIDAGEPKPDEILCLEMEMGKQELQERGVHSPPLNLPLLDIGKQELQESVSESESESESESFNAHHLETNMQELHESKIHISEVPSKKLEIFFLIINILLELLSAVLDHLSSVYKPRYALFAMVTSFVATIICIMELSYKAGKERVVFRWESKLPWFYHSYPNSRRFGTVLEMTGLIFATLQTVSSTVAYILYLTHVKYAFNVSLLPLVLAMSLFCSKFMQKSNPDEPSKKLDNVELAEIRVKSS